MLTPNDIDVLIHFCVCPAPHERQDAPAVREAIQKFCDEGLLKHEPLNRSEYSATEKGRAHLAQLCNMPYPTQAWVDANGKVIE